MDTQNRGNTVTAKTIKGDTHTAANMCKTHFLINIGFLLLKAGLATTAGVSRVSQRLDAIPRLPVENAGGAVVRRDGVESESLAEKTFEFVP